MKTKFLVGLLLAFFVGVSAFAGDDDFPKIPNPPRLVNDFAGMMNASEQAQLEAKLLQYEQESSTQITVVTITNLGGYDVAQYAIELGNRWKVGKKGKDNGVVILASKDDRKVNISTGYGVEGALTDATSGVIIRQIIIPQFKRGDFYGGFDKAADAVIAATKGEFTADPRQSGAQKKRMPAWLIIILIIVVYLILWAISKKGGGGNGGGGYVSRRGYTDLATGMLLGNLLGGSRGGGFGGGSGGFGGGSGGFGGFGGGSFGGGGASGSW